MLHNLALDAKFCLFAIRIKVRLYAIDEAFCCIEISICRAEQLA
jgi:hypothetical protein